jgi:hypothetical protein
MIPDEGQNSFARWRGELVPVAFQPGTDRQSAAMDGGVAAGTLKHFPKPFPPQGQ